MRVSRRECLAGLASAMSAGLAGAATDKMAYWSEQRKGANGSTSKFRPEWFAAAREAGIEYVRISPDLWPSSGRDFLIGNADDFRQISEPDFTQLVRMLDEADRNGLKVVLVMFSLPGCRWKQRNGDVDDARLWKEERYQDQAFAYWRELAARLKDHPAVAAYNPLNEPHPERAFGFDDERDPKFSAWRDSVRGGSADLQRFNQRMVAAIRESDAETPILLDGWFYASPRAFDYNEPVADDRTLYAFHNLGPWPFTTFRVNKGRFAYPDRMPSTDGTASWTRANLEEIVAPVERFAERHGIPRWRIAASEFWCDRRIEGAQKYLEDEIGIYNDRGWHWAFYSFRSDNWDGLDYELGPGAKLGQRYWQAVERGEDGEPYKRRGPNPLWDVIGRELRL
jgi:hypothetical protein